jgi:hypothetical protein
MKRLALVTLLALVVLAGVNALGQGAAPVRWGPASCPKRIHDATGPCADGGVIPSGPCEYPEGRCNCQAPFICSGVPRPAPPASAYRWMCQMGRVRPDGCSWDAPPDNGACSGHPAQCPYGSCGGMVYGCVDGGWHVVQIISPPP